MSSNIVQKFKELHWLQKSAVIVTLVLALYTTVGFLLLPPIVKYVLRSQLSKHLQREASIERLYFNPWALSIEIDGLKIKDKDSPADTFVAFKKFYGNLAGRSIFLFAPVVQQIELVEPYFRIVRIDGEHFNFSDLLQQKKPEGPGGQSAGPVTLPKFSIEDLRVRAGKIEIADRLLQKDHTIADINFTIPAIDNLDPAKGAQFQPDLTLAINNSPAHLSGDVQLLPQKRGAAVNVNLENVELAHYSPYLPEACRFAVTSGQLGVKTQITFEQPAAAEPMLKVTADATLSNLHVAAADGGELLGLEQLLVSGVEFEALAGRLHIADVDIQGPTAKVARDAKGQVNLAALYIPPPQQERPTEQEPQANKPFAFILDELKLAQGKIAFSDGAAASPFSTTLYPLEVNVKNFSNAPEAKLDISFSAKTEAGETLSGNGAVSLAPLSASGTISLTGLSIPKYAPYFQNKIPFEIKGTTVDFATDYHFAQGAQGPAVSLHNMKSAVHSLALGAKGESDQPIQIGSIGLSGGSFDLAGKQLTIAEISSSKGALDVVRQQDGQLNLLTLLAPPRSGLDEPGPEPAEASAPAGGPTWHVAINSVKLSDYAIRAQDRQAPEPVTITADNLQLGLQNVSLDPSQESGLSLSLLLNQSGKISIDGKLRLQPLLADLRLNWQDIEIKPFEPYFRDQVKVYVVGGKLAVAGNFRLEKQQPDQLVINYAGDFGLFDFTSLPKAEGDEIVKWQTFALTGIKAGNAPLQFEAQRVDFFGFTFFVRINPDGTINFRQVLKDEAVGPTAAKAAAPPPAAAPAPRKGEKAPRQGAAPAKKQPLPVAIKIHEVVLKDGDIDFTDSYIQPSFHARFYSAAGTITGLSTEPGSQAAVQIKAKVDEHAPAQIVGKINPLTPDLFLDMSISAKNLDLTITNPYARKFAGYPVKKGKLNFDFKYKIAKDNLDANHRLEFDNLTLGEKVNSPDATDLPIKFALSLMQDRNGDMVLELPISGKLSDPKFDFSKIIKAALSNIMKKIVTAPFAMLGSIFGAARPEDLNYVEFAPGSSDITPEAAKKLDIISKGLFERPKLELDITGYVDQQADAKVLLEQKQKQLQQAEAARQQAAQAEPKGKAGGKGEAKKPTQQAPTQQAQKAEAGQKGAAPAAPAAKLELDPKELEQLAANRAKSVRDYLLKSGQLEPERIYIVAADSPEPKGDSKVKKSSAVLSLK